ncbi:hypothetical protein NC651_031222 [Populus alba x Populus x berolinensis]|nr:hypothetical protein NC651_031222 [Populus alba x Populus x berolinensis]
MAWDSGSSQGLGVRGAQLPSLRVRNFKTTATTLITILRARFGGEIVASLKSDAAKGAGRGHAYAFRLHWVPSNATSNNDEEESNAGPDAQSSSSCSSEDDNASKDSDSKVSEAVSSSGKTRASRGAATDPQSLYARKRRERINERLKILQKIVPNGTKLLSSDDLWMYAPLAYSGIDIGLDQKLSMLL